jgi:hypothetical protein
MKIEYVPKKFTQEHLGLIKHANTIIEEYLAQGYDLTLRQLYYQFVSRDLIPNTMKEYKRLGGVINDARLAGHISWKAIIDRTRNLERNPHWESAKDFMTSVTPQFQMDKWANQPNRVEVWVEKDALVGVIERVCRENDVAFFACRGYTSQSEMWAASQRLIEYRDEGQTPVIIHLGDHDPSGVDMSRDINDRLDMFMGDGGIEVNRVALNMDQVRKYRPPPNPAKITDARATKYIKKFGRESWELDALEPRMLNELIAETIESYRDHALWRDAQATEDKHKSKLITIAKGLK